MVRRNHSEKILALPVDPNRRALPPLRPLIVDREEQMSDLNISNRQSGSVTIVDLAGKIALGESNRALHEAIRALTAEGQKNILLNLANVTLIDSSGWWARLPLRWRPQSLRGRLLRYRRHRTRYRAW